MPPRTVHDPSVYQNRRRNLGLRLPGRAVLLAAGDRVGRNYAANAYPFRASSHFLYFVGRVAPGAFALLRDDDCTVFLPAPGPDDEIWLGTPLSLTEWRDRLGCAVSYSDALPSAVLPKTLTLPGPDRATCDEQSALLGRRVEYQNVSNVDLPLAHGVIELRLIHDASAASELRHAAHVTANVHAAGVRATRPGIREHEVRASMEAEAMKAGMTMAYPPIVTTRGEILHCETYDNELREGDVLLADVGAETANGWASDVTRCWPVGREFSPEQRAIYDAVLSSQMAAIAAVRPGVEFRDLHLATARALSEALVDLGVLHGPPADRVEDGLIAEFFPHGLGHLIGLDVHDMEDLGDLAGYASGRRRSSAPGLRFLRLDRDLRTGMAVTIEPGIYFSAMLPSRLARHPNSDRVNFSRLRDFEHVRGIRIEDDVMVTDHGAEVLSAGVAKIGRELENRSG